MNEHDPATAASLEDLAACLRHVHLCADRPAYRTLEQQTASTGGSLPGTRLKRARLTRATVSDVLLGRKFPGKAFLLTFVDACGIDLETDRRWEEAWDRLAAQYRQVSAAGEEEKLRQENEELRRQLADAHHRAEARETSAEHELEELRRQLAAAKHQAETAEHRASQEQRRAEMAESQLETAIRRATTAENHLERERKLFGSSFASAMPHHDQGDAPPAPGGTGARSGLASIPGLGAVTATDAADVVCSTCVTPLPTGRRRRILPLVMRITFPTGNVDIPAGTSVLLGRDPAQSLVAAAFVRFENVSRRHATVQVDDTGHASIRDEGSTRGTYVNDDRVLPGTEVLLVDGDRVRLAADVTGIVSLPQGQPEPDPALERQPNSQWR